MPMRMVARAMPIVRTTRYMRCFWPAKTCSTADRTTERFAFALAVRSILCQQDLGHRYSPVRLMCSPPSSETWAKRSGGTMIPSTTRLSTTSPSFMVFQNMMMAASTGRLGAYCVLGRLPMGSRCRADAPQAAQHRTGRQSHLIIRDPPPLALFSVGSALCPLAGHVRAFRAACVTFLQKRTRPGKSAPSDRQEKKCRLIHISMMMEDNFIHGNS